jgi:protein-disulfide isomerase
MSYKRVLCLCWLVWTFWALSAVAIGQQPSEVVAEVNGTKITRADLDKEEASKLLQVRFQTFMTEQKALEELIDNRLLEMAAARQHVTVEQLVDREITSQVKDPSEEQLRFYYDDSNSSEPYETARKKILDVVRQRRIAKARTAYLEQLRSEANVFISLAPPVAVVAVGDAPRLGPGNAAVQLIEFADYECPYCAKVFPHLQKLHEQFGNQLAIYYKDFPLPMHAHAQKAAEAARCAGAQGKFWEYHDRLFATNALDTPQLKQYARELGLNASQFDRCLDSGEQASGVQKDLSQAQQLGVNGTPSFFVEGHYLSGAVDYNTLRDLVIQQINAKKVTPQMSHK